MGAEVLLSLGRAHYGGRFAELRDAVQKSLNEESNHKNTHGGLYNVEIRSFY